MTYTNQIEQNQDDDAFILTEDKIVSSPEAGQAFLDRLPDYNDNKLRRSIIQEWRTRCYNEYEAVFWLIALDLLKLADDADPYIEMVRIARTEFGDVELPERSEAPIPDVSRKDPFKPRSK